MKHLRILAILAAFSALAVGVGAVIAALGDSETASGSITVSSDSADLYICEPGAVAGPDCGADDSDGAEFVFERDEAFVPGESQFYDLRLKNMGNRSFVVTSLLFDVLETTDPGSDCPDDAIRGGGHPDRSFARDPVWILGKAGDPLNDNSQALDGRTFPTESEPNQDQRIYIAPGDYEDVRLRLYMELFGTENCDGTTWDVSYEFTVN